MNNEQVGYIYILTNEAFHKSNWIKIGYTENVEKRVRELYNTSLPTPFEVYATYEVPAISDNADVFVHNIIQKLNPSLRLTPNREFFEIEPWDAYDILEAMAKIHNRIDKLCRNKKNKFFNDLDKIDTVGNYTQVALFPQGSYIEELFNKVKEVALNLYPNLSQVVLKNYITFKKDNKRNVISIWPKANSIEIVLHAKLGTLVDNENLIYDISNRLWSSAQYALRFDETINTDYIKNLINQTYNLIR